MHCRDCKWYEPTQAVNDAGELETFDSGKCLLLSDWSTNYFGAQSFQDEPPELTRAKDNALAYADNAEDYHAWLTVFPDFGCVHFTAKD